MKLELSQMSIFEFVFAGDLGELVFTLEDSQETDMVDEESFNEEQFELME